MKRPGCKAVQESDQMRCASCGLLWDVNDPEPPECKRHQDPPRFVRSPAPEIVRSGAVAAILAERERQVTAEGYTPYHDDRHELGQLAEAAACYAANAGGVVWADPVPSPWPWEASHWKPSTPRRDLVKAGALILAEIERLDRLGPGAEYIKPWGSYSMAPMITAKDGK